MNIHHLELFYYVARHSGIMEAVRKIPYGIQQPAVSGQMGKLEQEVGMKLFERSPFRLTPAGVRLFAHVQPFFDGLEGVSAELRRTVQPELRIGGAELVLRDHLPAVMQRLRADFPKLRFSLRTTGFQSEVEAWLRTGLIDVAFTPLPARAPAGLQMARFTILPLVLQVHRQSGIKSAEELWGAKENRRATDLPAGKFRNRARLFPGAQAPRRQLAAIGGNHLAGPRHALRGQWRWYWFECAGRSARQTTRCPAIGADRFPARYDGRVVAGRSE